MSTLVKLRFKEVLKVLHKKLGLLLLKLIGHIDISQMLFIFSLFQFNLFLIGYCMSVYLFKNLYNGPKLCLLRGYAK